MPIVQVGSETLVNTLIASSQSDGACAALTGGGFVEVWYDATDSEIWVQLFSDNGSKNGSPFLAPSYTSGIQSSPGVVALTGGGFAVCWEGEGTGAANGVWSRIFNAAGTAAGSQLSVADKTIGFSQRPKLAGRLDGGFSVSYLGEDETSSAGVFDADFDSDGLPISTERAVNAYTPFLQSDQVNTRLTNGEPVVVWRGLGGDGHGVYVKIGSSTESLVSTVSKGQQDLPYVFALANGNFVVLWLDKSTDSYHGQVLTAAGVQVGTQRFFIANSDNDLNKIVGCDVTESNFAVFWTNGSSGSYVNSGAVYDPLGSNLIPEFVVSSPNVMSGAQGLDCTSLSDGRIVINYESNTIDTQVWGVNFKTYYPLALINSNQAITYTEDTLYNLAVVNVVSLKSPAVTVTLTLSDSVAGNLNTATSGSVTSTYVAGTGVWQASGAVNDVNILLAGLQFTPAEDYNSDFTVAVLVDDGFYSVGDTMIATGTSVTDAPKIQSGSSGSLAFTEGNAATVIDPLLGLTAERGTCQSATVSISSNFSAGEDILVYSTVHSITGAYNGTTGVLELTGSASAAQYQDALRAVQYQNAEQNPSSLTRTISFVVNDGVEEGNIFNRNLSVAPVNDIPVLTSTSSGALSFTEGEGAIIVDPLVTVSDVDSENCQSARVEFTSGFSSGKDVLGFVNQNGITHTYNTTSGILELTGLTTKANYQIALRSVTYSNAHDDPGGVSREVSFTINDGLAESDPVTRTINVTPVNDVPILASTSSGALLFTEGNLATIVDPLVTVSDVDSENCQSARIEITDGFSVNNDVLGFVNQNGIAHAYNATTGVLTLTGSATTADYQMALRSITYSNANEDLSETSRIIAFTINDGLIDSNTITRTIDMTAVNDRPVLSSVNADPLTFTEGNGTVVVDPLLTVTDVDNTHCVSATVSITAGFMSGEDTLKFVNQNNIVGSYSSGTGILTLTGSDTKAHYQDALRSVEYENLLENPSDANRTIAFVINDGNLDSLEFVRDVYVIPVNDVPVLTSGGAGPVTFIEQTGGVSIEPALTITDVDNTNLESAVVSITTNFVRGEDTLVFTTTGGISGDYNADTGVLTFTGSATVTSYLSTLRSVQYQSTVNNPDISPRTISFSISDGLGNSNLLEQSVNVTAVNDAPYLTSPSMSFGAASFIEGGTPVLIDSLININDVDSNTFSGATVSITGGHVNSEDVLIFNNQNGITGNFVASSGILTLSGTATLADYQTALRSIEYQNTAGSPNTGQRTVALYINDGEDISVGPYNRNIDISRFGVSSTSSSPVSFTENGSAVVVDPSVTIDYLDGSTINFAIVSIADGFEADDSLLFSNQNGISGTYNAGSLILNGATTVANYQAALRTVQFQYSGEDPAPSRAITFQVHNGASYSNQWARSVNVIAVNDEPILSTTSSDTLNFTENDGPTPIDPLLNITDLDAGGNYVSATIWISNGFIVGEDALSFANTIDISGNYNATTGELVLTGSASMSDYQAALRSVSYENLSDDPSATNRTVSFRVNDSLESNILSRTLTVTPVNDPPALTSTSSSGLVFTEGNSAIAVDTQLSITDVDTPNIQGATVSITVGFVTGEDVLVFSDQNGITGSYDSGSGELTLTGSATTAQYQAALRSVQYLNSHQDPTNALRTISFSVNDGLLDSVALTRDLSVNPVNDQPVLASTSSGSLQFSEKSSPISVDPLLTLQDDDNVNIQGAVVSITSGFVNGEDSLVFSDQNGITGSYNSGSGELTLTGSATKAQYQTALRSVQYTNSEDNPDTALRTVSFVVNDGALDSNTLMRNVSVLAVNDVPQLLTTSSGYLTFTEDDDALIIDPLLTISDIDSTMIQSAEISIAAGFSASDELQFIAQNGISGSYNNGVLALTGTASLADYQAALRTVKYYTADQNPSAVNRTISFVVNDGVDDSLPLTRVVSVVPVNDPPYFVLNRLAVQKGESINLTSDDIQAHDAETPDDQLEIVIEDEISFGEFMIGTPGSRPASFLQSALGQVSFTHDGSDNLPSYNLTVYDTEGLSERSAAIVSFISSNITTAPSTAPSTTPSIAGHTEGGLTSVAIGGIVAAGVAAGAAAITGTLFFAYKKFSKKGDVDDAIADALFNDDEARKDVEMGTIKKKISA